jgi:hypothetical protein
MYLTPRAKRRFLVSVGAIGLATLMSVTTALPASADGVQVVVPTVQKSADASRATLMDLQAEADQWKGLGQEPTDSLLAKAFAGEVAVMGGLRLEVDRAVAWQVDPSTRILRVPAATGQGVTEQSSVSVVFNSAEEVVGYTQMVFTPVDEKSGRVQSWVNGVPNVDQIVTAQADRAASSGQMMSRAYKKGDWWGNFNQCLSNAGIAAWVITGISIACAAVCVVTAGLGCIACLGAASAGFSGTVSYCITTANLNS